MRYPENLRENGTIGFVAPSFGATIEPYKTRFLNCIRFFEGRGHKTVIGPNVFASHGVGISATPSECARELVEAYESPDTDVLISVGGGELMCDTVSEMDFERIKRAKPKWHMGFSDNTNFSFLSATLCDTAAFYSYHAPDFGREPVHPSVEDAYRFLTGECWTARDYPKWEISDDAIRETPLHAILDTEEPTMKTFQWDGEKIEGRFIGGCLDVLSNLCGTRFDHVKEFTEKYRSDGIVWYLEACDLQPIDVRRALWKLKEAGWFEHVKAFLIGRPGQYDAVALGMDRYTAVTEILKDFQVPILTDLDIGHLPPMMTMICGGYGTLTRKTASPLHLEIQFKKR